SAQLVDEEPRSRNRARGRRQSILVAGHVPLEGLALQDLGERLDRQRETGGRRAATEGSNHDDLEVLGDLVGSLPENGELARAGAAEDVSEAGLERRRVEGVAVGLGLGGLTAAGQDDEGSGQNGRR